MKKKKPKHEIFNPNKQKKIQNRNKKDRKQMYDVKTPTQFNNKQREEIKKYSKIPKFDEKMLERKNTCIQYTVYCILREIE